MLALEGIDGVTRSLSSNRLQGGGRLWASSIWSCQPAVQGATSPRFGTFKASVESAQGRGAEREQSWGPSPSYGFSLGSHQAASPLDSLSVSWGAAQLCFGVQVEQGSAEAFCRLALQEAPTTSDGTGHSLALPARGFPAGLQNPPSAVAWPVPGLRRDPAWAPAGESQRAPAAFALGPWARQVASLRLFPPRDVAPR